MRSSTGEGEAPTPAVRTPARGRGARHELRRQLRARLGHHHLSQILRLRIYNTSRRGWDQPNLQRDSQPRQFFKIPWLGSLDFWRACYRQGIFLTLQVVHKLEGVQGSRAQPAAVAPHIEILPVLVIAHPTVTRTIMSPEKQKMLG
ncbi:hypothetical protein HAX54_041519 [Datura stramonium]|uniref:Uncharacterized protein n=1 Tax=Datura stramonium TaxID=4076 RepID=A0ABS8RGZ7_DATST|nr:hypothetical protein [Datura stramonium]